MTYPLAGIRVLDMSRVLAGPFAGRMLADLGADVVKVEPPEGDVTRTWGVRINGRAGYFNQQNVGKRGMSIDLNAEGAVDLVKRLAARADVLIENFRPDVMGRLGLAYAVLKEINPRLVMLSISGFGHNGPESRRAAYAPIVHAESGLIARQRKITGAHATDIGVSIADTNAALHGLVGLLSALLMRERTGVGQHIDIAMVDSMLVTDDHLHYTVEGVEHLKPMPSEVWDTAGGTMLIASDFRHVWKQLVARAGVVDPTPDDASLEEKIRIRRETARAFFKNLPDRAAVIAVLDKMNLAYGDVREGAQALELPTVKHRGTITHVDDGAGGKRPVVQSPYRFSAAESGARGASPTQGQHNADVLADWLGLDAAAIDSLWSAGVLTKARADRD
ncbi:MAG TPA: CaiB/BaiF CoA-transferase family protein [Pseudomonadales bacterium]|nr:CaiB/BaiF CoA-transferase family protein [Pseudomonadales bacterium]